MRKLGRTSDSRNAMLRAMVTYLFENGKIETTVTRAKEVRSIQGMLRVCLSWIKRQVHWNTVIFITFLNI